MFLNKLSLFNFKNYEQAAFHFKKDINCFTGRNGCGKTNLLDAIYYSCLTKSYFSASDQYNIKHDRPFLTLIANISDKEEDHVVKCKVAAGRKKDFFLDEVKYEKLAEHVGRFPVIFITPYDSALILEGSEERRKFLDGLLSQIDHDYLSHLQQYNKLLAQRNALLKRFAETNSFNASLLSVYTEKMIEPAQYVSKERKKIVQEITPVFTEIYRFIANEREEVKIDYDTELSAKSLEQLFAENLERDRILKRTTAGIHRDDLLFIMDEHVIKRFGSQGQQKSFLVSLKLAQYKLLKTACDKEPFLLLDDIFDKLDEKRSANLLKYITEHAFGQIFISDAQKERVEKFFAERLDQIAIFQIDEMGEG